MAPTETLGLHVGLPPLREHIRYIDFVNEAMN
jgi:hypothetical protein